MTFLIPLQKPVITSRSVFQIMYVYVRYLTLEPLPLGTPQYVHAVVVTLLCFPLKFIRRWYTQPRQAKPRRPAGTIAVLSGGISLSGISFHSKFRRLYDQTCVVGGTSLSCRISILWNPCRLLPAKGNFADWVEYKRRSSHLYPPFFHPCSSRANNTGIFRPIC